MKKTSEIIRQTLEQTKELDQIINSYFDRNVAYEIAPIAAEQIREYLGQETDHEFRSKLREVWHNILREHGRYSCFAVYLLLPSDIEAKKYLTEYSRELEIITSTNCLAISLCTTRFERTDENSWKLAVDEHLSQGYSAIVANLFQVKFNEFPCLIIFNDIRSSDHALVSLKYMTAEQIADKMRTIFSVIDDAVKNDKQPLAALEQQRVLEFLKKQGNTTISELRSFAGKSFETVMETWIKASMKSNP